MILGLQCFLLLSTNGEMLLHGMGGISMDLFCDYDPQGSHFSNATYIHLFNFFFFFFLCTTSGAINGTFLFVKLNVDLIEACLRVSTSLL